MLLSNTRFMLKNSYFYERKKKPCVIIVMKYFTLLFSLLIASLLACNDGSSAADDEYTGRELVYDLFQTSEFPTSGNVTFRERTGGEIEVSVTLDGTEGDIYHPVHLHFGDLDVPDAEIAFLLNDLLGETGTSSTLVSQLSDETIFTFDMIDKFDGSVKVHLGSTGEARDVVLAGGNIGINKNISTTGRKKVSVCKSE